MRRQNRIAFLNILSTVLLNGIAIFTAPLFSRLLGDSGYGVLSIYNIWVSVIAIAFAVQTQGTLVNARVEYPQDQQEPYQSSVMFLSLVAYGVCSALVLVLMGPVTRFLQMPWYLVIVMLIHGLGTYSVHFLSTKYVYEFKAGRKLLLSVTVTLTSLALSLVLVLAMPQQDRYLGRIFGIAATYGLIGIPACLYVLLRGKTLYHREYWKFCLALAVPTVFYNLSDLLLGQSDQVMIQQMLDSAQVGHYAYALKFGGIMYIIFSALLNTWAPFFFEDMKQGKVEDTKARARNFLEVFAVLSMGFLLLSREVFHVYARQDFWPGTKLIPIFVLNYFGIFLCSFPINYEYYRKKTKVVAVVTVGAAVVNIALNYLMIQWMGILGAAVATAVSHGLQLALHYGYARYFLGKEDYPFPLKLWGPYAAAVVLVVVLTYLTPEWWLLRWGLGAALGLWELTRLKKRKVLI